MDTGMDAGPSGQSEAAAGHTVIDAAEGYELQNVRATQAQSAGSRAPNESVTGDTAVNSAGPAQPDEGPRPDATDAGTSRPYTQSSIGNSESSSQNVTGARANDGGSVDQTARPEESDPAHQDNAAAQDDGSGAGSPGEPFRDSVIDVDGSQSASASDHGESNTAPSSFNDSTAERRRAYLDRLRKSVGDEDWERCFNPSEASLSDDKQCVFHISPGYFENVILPWRPELCTGELRKSTRAIVGFNVGLMTILHLGAMFNIVPGFFRDHIRKGVREEATISISTSGIWFHFACGNDEPLPSFSSPQPPKKRNLTFSSIYWPEGGAHSGPVLALINDSNIVEPKEMKGHNSIQRMAWESYKKVFGNASESRKAATTLSTLAGEAKSYHWQDRVIEDYLLRAFGSESPSELMPMQSESLRLAKFMISWLSGQVLDVRPLAPGRVQEARLPGFSHVDVALLRRYPTPERLDVLRCSMDLEFWQYNTDVLERQATYLADHALVEPTFTTFRSLNHCRQLVNRLFSKKRYGNLSTLERLCNSRKLVVLLANLRDQICHGHEPPPADDFDNEARLIQERLVALESRLKETFTLLVQAVTVVDSDANKKAASRATWLTLLAALYLPATLTTGIFGMNVERVTGDADAADWRFVIYTFLVLLAPSVAFIGYIFLPRGKQRSAPVGGRRYDEGHIWRLWRFVENGNFQNARRGGLPYS